MKDINKMNSKEDITYQTMGTVMIILSSIFDENDGKITLPKESLETSNLGYNIKVKDNGNGTITF